MKEDIKQKILILAFAVVLVTIAVGISYAFFSASTNNDSRQNVSVKSGNMELTFSDGDNGISAKLTPGQSVTKKLTLENTGTLNACGTINWYNLVNEYTDGSLTYDLQESSELNGTYTSITNGNVPKQDGLIKSNLCLEPTDKRYYNLIIKLNDLGTEINQTKDSNAHFSSYFNMVGNKISEFIITLNDEENESIITKGCGETLNNLPIPTKENYKFDGWFTEKDGGTKINKTTIVNNNATYYAHWTVLVYSKEVASNNGNWIGVYTCKNGIGTLTQCKYKNGLVCDGGNDGGSAIDACITNQQSINLTGWCTSNRLSTRADGGAMSETISC